jgi:hypothetical protein
MAISKTVVKKVRQQVFVKFVGNGTANIDLNADLSLPDETFEGYSNCNVNINTVIYDNGSSSNPITVTRNNTIVLELYGVDTWSFSQLNGFVLSENNNSNVVVTIPSPGGTIILGLSKLKGHREPSQQRFVSGNPI